MVITYTEVFASFAIGADAAWTNYDLFTNQGVPKGAIAEIVCANKNVDNERTAGVRTDGSGLNRYISIHEPEGDGVTTSTMLVKCDSSTGLIECYAEIAADVDFYLLGYFEGCDFTERFDTLGAPVNVWVDKDLGLWGCPPFAVVQVLGVNDRDLGNNFIGARERGSAFERGFILDEAEGGGNNCISLIVKADWDSYIQLKGSNGLSRAWTLGWFNDVVDFIEGWTEYIVNVDSTWESKTIAEAAASSIVAFALVHEDTGKETYCGLRSEGGGLGRMIEEHEAEQGRYAGFEACITLDADKKCEVYCQDADEADFYYSGYFADFAVGWTGKISGVTNPAEIAGVAVVNIAKVKGVA